MWIGVVLGALLCGLAILIEALIRRKEDAGFPPGPYPWPVVGNLYLLRGLPHQNLRKLSRRYGHILGLRLGQQRAVVVSSPELAKEVLLTHDKVFADRPPFAFSSCVFFGSENGLIFTRYGQRWRRNRKLCMLQLFTPKRLQDPHHLRHEELHYLLVSIHRHSLSGSTPLDFGKLMGGMSSRLLLRLLYSDTIPPHSSDENLHQLIRETELLASPIFGDLIPALSFLDFFKKQHMRRVHDRLYDLHSQKLKERRQNLSFHDDLLNALLSDKEGFSEQEMHSILHDVLGAGIHTTAITLEWVMAELMRNPHCLQRLRAELETEVEKEKQVSEEDLHKLTYLKCVVKETFRLHPVAPLLLPRVSMEECEVQGYRIPAKTLVFVNVWAIGRDEAVWHKAEEFMPDRFQGMKGNMEVKGQHFELLPFGAGRRVCVGLPLVEVIIANLVKHFDWELPAGETPASINMDEEKGITLKKATPLMVIPKALVSFPDASAKDNTVSRYT